MKKKIYFLVLLLVFFLTIMFSLKLTQADLKVNNNIYDNELIYMNEFIVGDYGSSNQTPNTNYTINNQIKLLLEKEIEYPDKFNLIDLIPENTTRMLQKGSSLCWDFTTLDILETSLALSDFYNKRPVTVYDFSEINATYSLTTNYFLNNNVNKNGLNRKPNQGGTGALGIDLLTSIGVTNENFMPFNEWYDTLYENKNIDIEYINNRKVAAQVFDTVDFPVYNDAATTLSSVEFNELNNKVKNHLMNYGGLYLSMSFTYNKTVNNVTSAIYCDNTSKCPTNHSVTIIGWDDTYSKTNFLTNSQPKSDGAWIVNNSMGYGEQSLDYLREQVRDAYCSISRNVIECNEKGWKTNPELITNEALDETLVLNNYLIDYDNNTAYQNDNGIYYVSYEDAWIYSGLKGIIKADSKLAYDNIYQHNVASNLEKEFNTSVDNKIYISDIFKRNDINKKEYLSSVSIYAAETNNVKVYVNPNGSSIKKEDLHLVELKNGESETFNAGYHTLEFNDLILLDGEEFAIVLEIQGTRENKLLLKLEGTSLSDYSYYNDLHKNGLDGNGAYSTNFEEWTSFSNYVVDTENKGVDTTIKAFTVSAIERLEITNEPLKLNYIEGENFDPLGMVVKVVYKDGNKVVVDDYELENNTNLNTDINHVVINYQGFSVKQDITVEKNSIERLEIEGVFKTVYTEGENFDISNLKVFTIYKNNDKEEVVNYEILNYEKLKLGQKEVVIKYNELEFIIQITVNEKEPEPLPIVLEKIIIKQKPDKIVYYLNEELDLTGGIITLMYSDKTEKNLEMVDKDITVSGYDKNKVGLQYISLSYNNMVIKFDIDVIKNVELDKILFENAKGYINKIDIFNYPNDISKNYMLLETQIKNVENNNGSEYYFYVSSHKNEDVKNITNWIKINEQKSDNSNFIFVINTLDIINKDLFNADNFYIYFKEVSNINNKNYYSKSITLEKTSNINEHINENVNENPKTGLFITMNFAIFCVFAVICLFLFFNKCKKIVKIYK